MWLPLSALLFACLSIMQSPPKSLDNFNQICCISSPCSTARQYHGDLYPYHSGQGHGSKGQIQLPFILYAISSWSKGQMYCRYLLSVTLGWISFYKFCSAYLHYVLQACNTTLLKPVAGVREGGKGSEGVHFKVCCAISSCTVHNSW